MEYSIIVNPLAGSGRAKKIWQQLQSRLNKLNIVYQVVETRYHGHAVDLAERIAHHFASAVATHVVMVVGGDGTLHETLNGLIKANSSLPLAYIPAGSGNDFARGYGLSQDPMTALQQVLYAQHPTRINVGHYYDAIKQEEGYFLNNLGIGFDAAIVSQANASSAKKRLNRWHLGNLSYLSQALGVLYNQEPFETMVQEKNGHHHLFPKTFILIASNHPYIGGGFKIAPDESLHSSTLELLVVERRNWLITFWCLRQFARGRLNHSRFAKCFRSSRLHYVTTSLEFAQTDGEEMGSRFMDLTLDTCQYPFWGTSLKEKKFN